MLSNVKSPISLTIEVAMEDLQSREVGCIKQ